MVNGSAIMTYGMRLFAFVCLFPLLQAPKIADAQPDNNYSFDFRNDSFRIDILTPDHRILTMGVTSLSEFGGFGVKVDGVWYPFNRISDWVDGGTSKTAVAFTSAGHRIRLAVSHGPNSTTLGLEAGEDVTSIGYGFTLSDTEHLAGLGQRFDGINLREREIPTFDQEWTVPIPFFLSSAGYGLYLETKASFTFNFGTINKNEYRFNVDDNKVIIHLIGGPAPARIVERYTSITGRMMRPPDWQLGLWKWRDWVWNEFELYEDASMLVSLDIPSTVMLIDSPWSSEYFDFEFNKDQFPDPGRMIANLDSLGYKTILWVAPFMNEAAANFRLTEEMGYLVSDSLGNPLKLRWWNPSGSPDLGLSQDVHGYMIDFTNPAAKSWWQGQVALLIDLGVAGFKVDGGELLPDEGYLFDGRRGFEVKDYPALYLKALHDILTEKRGDDFTLLPRAGSAGSQQLSPAFWAADQSADFNDTTGLPSVIRGSQSMGLVGFPFWGSDIGGYQWSPPKDVLIRWLQFGAFSPVMQLGGKSIHEPWLYDDETIQAFRRYVQLYTHLKPYLKYHIDEALTHGAPIIRPMFFEYPDDDIAWESEMQYLYGSHFLVAPVYKNTDNIDVYLPQGIWMDFWTHDIYKGGGVVVNYDAPLWKLPLFVKLDEQTLPLLYYTMIKEQLNSFNKRVEYYLRGDAKFMRVRHQAMLQEVYDSYLKSIPDDPSDLSNTITRTSYLASLKTLETFLFAESESGQIPYHINKTLQERIVEIKRTIEAVRVITSF